MNDDGRETGMDRCTRCGGELGTGGCVRCGTVWYWPVIPAAPVAPVPLTWAPPGCTGSGWPPEDQALRFDGRGRCGICKQEVEIYQGRCVTHPYAPHTAPPQPASEPSSATVTHGDEALAKSKAVETAAHSGEGKGEPLSEKVHGWAHRAREAGEDVAATEWDWHAQAIEGLEAALAQERAALRSEREAREKAVRAGEYLVASLTAERDAARADRDAERAARDEAAAMHVRVGNELRAERDAALARAEEAENRLAQGCEETLRRMDRSALLAAEQRCLAAEARATAAERERDKALVERDAETENYVNAVNAGHNAEHKLAAAEAARDVALREAAGLKEALQRWIASQEAFRLYAKDHPNEEWAPPEMYAEDEAAEAALRALAQTEESGT